ncbi:MAG: hypothetical protein MRECE_9c019 [Mycoplasmataceae bacterium CE_OT135]|nr:MAG: hypothetical protein MRECE_9c019 [Mycoplasmataceae bacterium CE_OT135]
MTYLNVSSNNLSDLSLFSHLVNLERLGIGNWHWEKINQGIYNRFTGSLKPLQNLTKLKELDISNTDINRGLEYLPDSLKEFSCSVEQRKEAKCKAIYNLFANDQGVVETENESIKNFPQKLQEYKWRNLNFTEEEIKQWTDAGLIISEYELANHLRQKGYQPNTPNLKEIIKKESWRDIHQGFNYQLRKDWERANIDHAETKLWVETNFQPNQLDLVKEWKDEGFQVKQVKEWMALGFTSNELSLVQQWKRIFDYEGTKEWIALGLEPHNLSYVSKWKAEFGLQETKEWIKIGFKIDKPDQVKSWKDRNFDIQQTKEWINSGATIDDAKFVAWLRDVKKFGSEWVSNYKEDYQELSDRFKKYDLCSECNRLNTGEQWCQSCNSKHFQENFKKYWYDNILPNKWTSGNLAIDEFIQKYQLQATEAKKLLEWIPYEKFIEVEYLAEGGFGKVYKARWTEGNIHHWDIENKQWNREKDYCKDYREVVLKSLNNSQDNIDFLQETANHKIIDDWFNNIVPCYGISQDPNTGNYLMVMQYMPEGNLRHYLSNKNKELNLREKITQLVNISQGLKDLHQKKLVHRDFHSGNILKGIEKTACLITDLGLCRPADETKQEKIYGVMPYVAPEVLNSKSYTQAADIYSFGIVAYEILSSLPPYYDRAHNQYLGIAICQGLRPNFQIKIPPLLEDLIKKCWDADPKKRPIASELERNLRSWEQENTEFDKQLQEAEEYNKYLPNNIRFPKYKKHPKAVYHSKFLPTKEITQLLQSQELSGSGTISMSSLLDNLPNTSLEEKPEQQAQILQPTYGTPSPVKNN